MKKFAAAAGVAIALAAAPAVAGGVAPVTPVEVVVVDTQSSNGGILVPILAIILFAAAASN